MIYKDISELVGHTPVVMYDGLYIKLECYNPTGSLKDRASMYMIDKAIKRKELKQGDTIVEPTSGNTGIGLAAFGAIRGLKVVIVMPSSMSEERIKAIKAYGAEIILTDANLGMSGSIDLANELVKTKGYKMLDQFNNNDNILAHYETTAEEIIKDFPNLDYVVCGVGTGGTIMGLSMRLKKHYKAIKIIGVEPEESPMLSQNRADSHKIQGIGANFVPGLIDKNYIDEIITIKSEDCFIEMRELAKNGLFLGISSAAVVLAGKRIKKGKILVIAPDGGLKYLSVIK